MAQDLYREIVRLREAGEPAALATIIATHGSTPGKESMKMLVRADGTFVGTVGGGCLEADVFEAALEVMRTEKPRRLLFRLNERDYPNSGLYCGGTVEVYVEPLTDPTLFLLGAGHVSLALSRVAREAGFRVIVGDDRSEFALRERFPDAHEVLCAPWSQLASRREIGEFSYVVVVTRGHHDDQSVLEALHRAGRSPRYLGLIGSRAKWVVLSRRLREAGVSEEWIARVRTPMGLPIGALSHGEIAVSVVAEMIRLRRGAAPTAAENGVDRAQPAGGEPAPIDGRDRTPYSP